MVLQFGYVALFAAAFPAASAMALVSNLAAVRTGAFRMVTVFRRPVGEGATGIGAWQPVLLALSFLALLTNPAILCFTSHRIARAASPGRRWLLFAAIVHALLLLKLLVYMCTPAAPAPAPPPPPPPPVKEGDEGEAAPADQP